MSNEPVDVHNTGMHVETYILALFLGVSEQLKQLLSTLHEGESSPEISASGSAMGAQLGFSATAQEFVPGKLFTVPVERTQSTTGDQIAGLSLKADAPEFVPSWQAKPAVAGTTQQGGMLPVPSNGGSLTNVRVIDKKVWWYRDPAGVVRGPFSTTEMRAWADKGYFSVELEIALSDRGPYLPLSSVYPSPERAFWKTIEPREFATRMRQHILAARNVMISD